ncbi:MAG: hypothetical protein ACHQ5A_14470 [Opitutales bacterium]
MKGTTESAKAREGKLIFNQPGHSGADEWGMTLAILILLGTAVIGLAAVGCWHSELLH